MKYVLYISGTLCTQNKLQAAVRSYLVEHDRVVVDETRVKLLMETMIKGVEALNKEYPRCKPVALRFWEDRNVVQNRISDKDIAVTEPYFVSFRLLACREEW